MLTSGFRGRVVQGGCPPWAPTDPYVPNSGIRFLKQWVRFALRLRYPLARRLRDPGVQSLRHVSFQRVHHLTPRFPLPGRPARRPVPTSTVLSGRYDSRPPVPPHFVSFAWRYPRCIRSSLPRWPDAASAGLGTWFTRPPTWPTCSEGDDRASHVPGEPSCAYALLYDPGGTVPSGHHDGTTRPPSERERRLPATPISELHHTASALAVYASQGGLLRRHAKLASGGLARPTGGIRYPQGSGERFQRLLHHLILLI